SATAALVPFSSPRVRPPPTSPLFPYTTLFRSHPHGEGHHRPAVAADRRGGRLQYHLHAGHGGDRQEIRHRHPAHPPRLAGAHHRSEEHTSELQSRENLVCRLLLEKKKKQMKKG